MDPDLVASVLRSRSSRARAHRDAVAAQTRASVLAAVRDRLPAGARAWLIGSLAWGGFGARSDVDLVVDGVDARLATDLEVAIAKAAGVGVDLLPLAALTPSFRMRVLAEGVPIHAS